MKSYMKGTDCDITIYIFIVVGVVIYFTGRNKPIHKVNNKQYKNRQYSKVSSLLLQLTRMEQQT